MDYSVKTEGEFEFIETGNSDQPTLLLLHGLFGALSNFQGIISHFGAKMNVVVPILPIFKLSLRKASIGGLLSYVNDFVEYKGYANIHVLGNSLGGHIALLFALDNSEKLSSIVLTGSSGLFENAMGSSFPKRGNYEFIKQKTESTFYHPEVATKELVDEVFDIVNDRNKAIKVIATAKSAIRHNLENKLGDIVAPCLLIWGKNDTITPAFVGEKFQELIPNSELIFIDECGHAPMMEYPEIFNEYLESFLNRQAIFA